MLSNNFLFFSLRTQELIAVEIVQLSLILIDLLYENVKKILEKCENALIEKISKSFL
jgi:hypothetical protein